MSSEQKSPLGGGSPGEMALKAAIEAEKANPGKYVTAGVHALFRLFQNDETLKKQFLETFLPSIISELDACAENGSLNEIARHQMLSNVYSEVPEVEKHMKTFARKMSEGGYPWVGLVLRRIETGVASGMQVGNEELLIRSLNDLQRYIAVTGGVGVFGKLRIEVRDTLQSFYRKQLITHPKSDPLKLLQRKEQLDSLIHAFTAQGILDSGLEEVQLEIQTTDTCQPLCELADCHADLLGLTEKLELLKEARKGIVAAQDALKAFREEPIDPGLKRAIEQENIATPGVVQWRKEFHRLNQIRQYAAQPNLPELIEQCEQQVKKHTNLFNEAKEALKEALKS